MSQLSAQYLALSNATKVIARHVLCVSVGQAAHLESRGGSGGGVVRGASPGQE